MRRLGCSRIGKARCRIGRLRRHPPGLPARCGKRCGRSRGGGARRIRMPCGRRCGRSRGRGARRIRAGGARTRRGAEFDVDRDYRGQRRTRAADCVEFDVSPGFGAQDGGWAGMGRDGRTRLPLTRRRRRDPRIWIRRTRCAGTIEFDVDRDYRGQRRTRPARRRGPGARPGGHAGGRRGARRPAGGARGGARPAGGARREARTATDPARGRSRPSAWPRRPGRHGSPGARPPRPARRAGADRRPPASSPPSRPPPAPRAVRRPRRAPRRRP